MAEVNTLRHAEARLDHDRGHRCGVAVRGGPSAFEAGAIFPHRGKRQDRERTSKRPPPADSPRIPGTRGRDGSTSARALGGVGVATSDKCRDGTRTDRSIGGPEFRFYDLELNDFLAPALRTKRAFAHAISCTPSVKDVIEAIGVPHTEVDLVLVDGESRRFRQATARAANASRFILSGVRSASTLAPGHRDCGPPAICGQTALSCSTCIWASSARYFAPALGFDNGVRETMLADGPGSSASHSPSGESS